jgi:RNA polymerase sigma-70 factor (ECF subfamily)
MLDVSPTAAERNDSDEALMQSVAHHDPAALAKLYERYGSVLKALIVSVVHDEAEADDLLQEIFVQLWEQAGKFTPKRGKPLGWMVTLSRRRAIDRLRQRLAYGRAKDRMQLERECQPDACGHNRIEDDLELHDLHDFLVHRMQSLPPHQLKVLELAFFEGMSQREISNETHTPLGTVKTRIELGLRKMMDALGGIRDKI